MSTSTTGRDVILSIAKGFDDDTDNIYITRLMVLKRHDAEMLQFVKTCRELEKTVKPSAFPVAPFVVRSKIGRQKRQIVLNRLTSQHIVCLAQKDNGLKSVEDLQKDLRENLGVIEQARQKAVAQEEGIFRSCSTNQEYIIKSTNVTAVDWYKARGKTSPCEQTVARHTGGLKRPGLEKSKDVTRHVKRKSDSLLLDSDIDWENGVLDSDARKGGFKKRLKPVIIELVEETLPNNIEAEFKVKLVNDIISDAERIFDENNRFLPREKLKEKVKPIVRKATEAILLSQSIYYTV